jgi:hypothetical protein
VRYPSEGTSLRHRAKVTVSLRRARRALAELALDADVVRAVAFAVCENRDHARE